MLGSHVPTFPHSEVVALNCEVVDEWHFYEAVTADTVNLFPQNGNGHVLTLRESEQFDIISLYNSVKVPFVDHLAV